MICLTSRAGRDWLARAGTVLGQVGEGHAVVSQHGMDLVGKDLDHVAEEGRAFYLSRAVVEFDMGELGDPVDGEEHDELTVGMTEQCLRSSELSTKSSPMAGQSRNAPATIQPIERRIA